MPYDITERDVEVAAAVIAASALIDAPKLPAPNWMGLARRILEEVARRQNEVSLLRPATLATSPDMTTPEGRAKAAENAKNYRETLKPFA